MQRRVGWVVWLVVLGAISGCSSGKLKGSGCHQDSDCGIVATDWRCEVETGVCYCRTDQACDPRDYCNPAGFCQARSGCSTDADCADPTTFCDTSSNSCLPIGRCTSDLHCALGQICDFSKNTCVEGCRFNGDCAGSSCRCGNEPCNCTGETPDEIASCTVGVCDLNFCSDNSFCQFGQQCGIVPDAGVVGADGGAINQCYSDFDSNRRPYCANCTSGGGIETCGDYPNYCLIDTTHPGNFFCGVDCSSGQTCPRGYGCQDVIVVSTQWVCSASNPMCPINNTLPCSKDADCKHGGSCSIPTGGSTGFCVGSCGIAEGDPSGFCSCQVDSDCAQETCSMGECTISKRKCVNSSDCRPIRCVDFNGTGGCLIGENCAPANGLSCLEVQ